jgi:hypothetical protein
MQTTDRTFEMVFLSAIFDNFFYFDSKNDHNDSDSYFKDLLEIKQKMTSDTCKVNSFELNISP